MLFLTTLEKTAAQLVQQSFLITPAQALIQFLPILSDTENEVEKRAITNGETKQWSNPSGDEDAV